MNDQSKQETIAHDDLNSAFKDGSIFSSTPEDLERYIAALGAINIESEQVRNKAIIRALTINHIQASRTLKGVESTMKALNETNDKTQKLMIGLTWAAIALAIIQSVASIIALRK
jgi:hypothetical protein